MFSVKRGPRVLSVICLAAILAIGCASRPVDAVSKATTAMVDPTGYGAAKGSGVLIILVASPIKGTAKIADAIARQLDARVLSPLQADTAELGRYDLLGFGSGIFDQQHHRALLDLADRLPQSSGQRVFLFSTSGVSRRFALAHGIEDPHTPLRNKLLAKGYTVIDEFNCAGFNDNSFLKFFGGMNRGRPNERDMQDARAFADRLLGVLARDASSGNRK